VNYFVPDDGDIVTANSDIVSSRLLVILFIPDVSDVVSFLSVS